jgi:hypothetical protein
VKWVRDYSRVHGMLHKWRFLTGSLAELKRVWRAYYIAAAVVNGSIDHTPATYLIDPNGRESWLYETPMAYSSVNQLGYELAQSIAGLLPGHPRLQGTVSLAKPQLYGPHDPVMPRAPAAAAFARLLRAHLVLFFDSWETEVTDLSKQLSAQPLPGAAGAALRHSSRPTGGVEASPQALLLPHALLHPLRILAADQDGRVADGYRVQDSPWLPSSRVPARSSPRRISRSKAGRRCDSYCARRASRGRSKDFSANLYEPTGSCRT